MLKKKAVGYIYKITNKINGNVYVGQTHNYYEDRWKAHKYDAKKGTKKTKLVKEFVKYGLENFEFEVIEEVKGYHSYLLDIKETEYIRQYDSYHNGLNCDEGNNSKGYSEIKYIGAITNELMNILPKFKEGMVFRVFEEDIWLYKACLLLDTLSCVKDISINQNYNELYITIIPNLDEAIMNLYNIDL